MQDYTLKSTTAEAMQAALLALGFEWDGTSANAHINGFDFAFFGTITEPNPEDPEALIVKPGFHADAIGPAGFDFGSLAITVTGTRYHQWS
jgi:hypothetical protein